MVQSMDYICTLSFKCASASLDGVACSFFEFGVPTDVAQVVGAA